MSDGTSSTAAMVVLAASGASRRFVAVPVRPGSPSRLHEPSEAILSL